MTDTTNTVVSGDTVVTDCELPDAPEKVWKALTVPELLARWLPDARDCKVLAAERPRLLCYEWHAGQGGAELDSTVTFELTTSGNGGTHLRVIHRVASAIVIPFKRATRTSSSGGGPVASARVILFKRATRASSFGSGQRAAAGASSGWARRSRARVQICFSGTATLLLAATLRKAA
ncbi:MAG TPA: SRPBCC domain-containing protein [Steroidobacteraceae bacterium]|nr:SRPBCC domain-containing protein [Steroidobacteraceae bacterium]